MVESRRLNISAVEEFSSIPRYDSVKLIEQACDRFGCSREELPVRIIEYRSQMSRSPFGDLSVLEERYRGEAASVLHLELDSDWDEINDVLVTRFKSLNRSEKIIEFRRFVLAKFLQLNKFAATPDEILEELKNLGINLFSEA